MVILENIDIDKAILQNIDIDKISNRFKFGISNRAISQSVREWVSQWVTSRPRFNFITSTKHQRQNAEQAPVSKSCLNFNFKILTNPCAQSLNKSLALGPNVSSQICNKLLPTWSSLSTSATVTTSTSFELASSHARVTSIKFTKQQLGSQSVSDKHSQWSDSGPIKTFTSSGQLEQLFST